MALTNIDFDKLIIKEFDRITAFDKTDGSLVTIIDELKDGTVEGTQETVYGTGKSGVKLSALDKNKGAKITGNNGYVVMSTWAAQMGSDVQEASATNKFAVPDIEFITVTDITKIVLSNTAIGAVGKEFPFIYKANSDNTKGKGFPIAAAASATEFSYKPADKEVTLPTGIFAVGDVVIVPYDREVVIGKKLSNNTDSFSKTVRAVVDITCLDICDQTKEFHTVLVMPNAKLDGNWSLTIGNDPAQHPISLEAMKDPCSTSKKLFDYYIA